MAVWEYLIRNFNIEPVVSKDSMHMSWNDNHLIIREAISDNCENDNTYLIHCYTDGSVLEFAKFYRKLMADCLVNYHTTILTE